MMAMECILLVSVNLKCEGILDLGLGRLTFFGSIVFLWEMRDRSIDRAGPLI